MKTRMQPIDNVWSKLPARRPRPGRQLRQAGRASRWRAGTPSSTRRIIEAIKDPLTHLVRNAVDHGIEPPERPPRRRQAGRGRADACAPSTRAARSSSRSPTTAPASTRRRSRDKAVEQRAASPPSRPRGMSDREVIEPDLPARLLDRRRRSPTSPAAASAWTWSRPTSRRSAARSTCESTPGAGTTLRMKIPLTLAIIPALIVDRAGDRYAIPQVSLLELVRLEGEQAASRVETSTARRSTGSAATCCRWSTSTDAARPAAAAGDDGHVVHRRAAGRRPPVRPGRRRHPRHRGDRRQAARQPAQGDRPLRRRHDHGRRQGGADPRRPGPGPPRAAAPDAGAAATPRVAPPTRPRRDRAQRLLLVAVGGGRRVAIPLDTVTRLEEFRARPRRAGRRPRGRAVPRRDPAAGPARPAPAAPTARSTGERPRRSWSTPTTAAASAWSSSAILDIVEDEAAIRSDLDDLRPARLRRRRRQGHRAARRPGRHPRRRPGVLLDPPHRPDPAPTVPEGTPASLLEV